LNLVDAAEPLRVRIPASGGLKRESDAPVRRVEAAILEVLEIVERDGDGPQRPG
jgi:hypothetical protein